MPQCGLEFAVHHLEQGDLGQVNHLLAQSAWRTRMEENLSPGILGMHAELTGLGLKLEPGISMCHEIVSQAGAVAQRVEP